MDFPFINIKEIETGFALNLDDASGGVALLGTKMQYFVPCRSHISDLWNGKGGEQGQLAGRNGDTVVLGHDCTSRV